MRKQPTPTLSAAVESLESRQLLSAAAPTGVMAAPISASALTLWWNNPPGSGANSLRIEHKSLTDADWHAVAIVAANTTAYTEGNLPPGTPYSYRVVAVDAAGGSAVSNTSAASTLGTSTAPSPTPAPTPTPVPSPSPTPTPTPPTGPLAASVPNGPFALSLAVASASGIHLGWYDNADNAAGYRVERADGGGTFVPVAYLPADATSYDDAGLNAGASYTYRVAAYNTLGDSSYAGPNAATTLGAVPTPTPTPVPTPTPAPSPTPSPTPAPTPAPAGGGLLAVSADGHSLQHADGTPFFYLADTGWDLFTDVTAADAGTYFQNRAAKGFDVIQATLASSNLRSNTDGQKPFVANDPTRPNDAFFQIVDGEVTQANSLGLTMALMPAWGNLVSGNGGTGSSAVFDAASAYSYGKFLGQRYKAANVIWMLGGDVTAADAVSKATWDAMADGLNAGDGGTQLITFHPLGGYSSSQWFANDPRVSFEMIQSGHTADSDNYDTIAADYALAPAKPVVDGEANYEDIPNGLNPALGPITAWDVRKKAYWSVFAGAFGTAYGEMNVYQFWTPGQRTSPGLLSMDWHTAMDQPGAYQMGYLRKLMESRPLNGRVPDLSVLLSSPLGGPDRIQATRAADGSYAMIYAASGQPFVVNLSKISGSTANAWWFNPQTGKSQSAGRYATGTSQSFTPPTSGGGQDWVLVLDDASKGYATPG